MRSETPRKFRPGELAPVTGIYLVRHNPPHRAGHEAVIVRGETLPPCRTCKSQISYEILRVASHITHDWDFSGPSASAPQRDFANVRRAPRFNLHLPVVVQLARASGKGILQGVTQNLSECGLGAVTGAQRDRDGPQLVRPPVGDDLAGVAGADGFDGGPGDGDGAERVADEHAYVARADHRADGEGDHQRRDQQQNGKGQPRGAAGAAYDRVPDHPRPERQEQP